MSPTQPASAFTAGDSDAARTKHAGKRERKAETHKPARQLDEECPSALPALLPEGKKVEVALPKDCRLLRQCSYSALLFGSCRQHQKRRCTFETPTRQTQPRFSGMSSSNAGGSIKIPGKMLEDFYSVPTCGCLCSLPGSF